MIKNRQVVNEYYKDLFVQDKRYFILMGGRGAGRSTVAGQLALAKLLAPGYFRCAIMRYILGDIYNSIYQEIKDKIEAQGLENKINIIDSSLTFEYLGNVIKGIGFKKSSSDQKSKLKSLANYNYVIIEEADEVAEEDFMQLDDSLRTLKSDIKIILLLNPPHKNHWIIKRFFNLLPSGIDGFFKTELKSERTDTCFIHTTWENNEINLNNSTKRNYEDYKNTRPDYYYNMIRGLVSEGARGRVFKNWNIISDAEFEALDFDKYYGLDFGFTNDPTALVEIKEHNNKVYIRELIYEQGLTNQIIAQRLEDLGVDRSLYIYADSAEPKSIEEIRQENWNIVPATKGKDSVNVGIDMLLGKEVYYTESSIHIAEESQNYKWALDRNKEPTNKPIDEFNHLIDAIRYGVFSNSKQEFIGFV